MSFKLVKEHPIKLTLSFVVSGVFLYYAFKGLEWNEFIATLGEIHLLYVFIAGSLLIYSIWVRAQRWRILLSPQKDCKTYPLFQSLLIGYMGNNILPLRMGEIVRAVIASKFSGIPVSGTGTSVVIERVIDAVSFLILAGIYSAFFPTFTAARYVSIAGLIVVIVSAVFIMLMSKNHDRVQAKFDKWVEKKQRAGKEKMVRHARSIFMGLETVWNMPSPFKVVASTLFLWSIYLLITMLILQAFSFNYSPFVFFQMAAVLLIFTTLSLSVPAAPGAVGTYHGAVIIALGLFSVEKADAQVFAVVMHLLNYLVMTIPGVIYLFITGMNISAIVDEKGEET